jgi:hypothetical protein
MEKYRKPDEYYQEDYDRTTISILKQLEKDGHGPQYYDLSKGPLTVTNQMDPFSKFYETGVGRAQRRDNFIMSLKLDDEKKDRLVARYPVPEIVRCNECNNRMHLCNHFFREDAEILFVFECPKGHMPRKVLYPNGDEFFFKKKSCGKCGSQDIKTSSKKTKKSLTFTEKCKRCGEVTTDFYDLTFKKEEPITEEDRKKYITYFKGRRTFWQDLEAIANLKHLIISDEKLKNELYKTESIEKLKVAHLEERLIKLLKTTKFKKFKIQSYNTTRNVILEFTVQDSSDLSEKESKRNFIKIIQNNLLNTNWRLVDPSNLNYRMGIISGRLKAHETDEELIALAKQIQKKQSKK